ncbi:tigger transposable element-derived protein [Plakobranchus ocellatus]|uniref:Tigger transposable element-derived protein n=1 Tax=Plakobranchus ocellatus TaxID=259542 RepID=A0AAV3YBL1_9GAST|nr:tigger transposable element-derived protein [Plakobranchus ocellatus]
MEHQGSLGLAHSSGWMTADNFIHVLNHVIKHVRPSKEYPIILSMDNHESHISYPALELAKTNHIHIITLPPHTSNKTQPLDRIVFGPLKAAYNRNADSWMLQNPGKTITIYQLAQFGGDAFLRAAIHSNITSGFRVSGMWPLDRDVFDSEEYLSSDVTDRQLPGEPSGQATSSGLTALPVLPPSSQSSDDSARAQTQTAACTR